MIAEKINNKEENSFYFSKWRAEYVLLETGEAFVGCMAHNGFPFRTSPGLPIYAADIDKVRENWNLMLKKGAKKIYPGHGNPFTVEKMFLNKISP